VSLLLQGGCYAAKQTHDYKHFLWQYLHWCEADICC